MRLLPEGNRRVVSGKTQSAPIEAVQNHFTRGARTSAHEDSLDASAMTVNLILSKYTFSPNGVELG
jgi:hypothetical protein